MISIQIYLHVLILELSILSCPYFEIHSVQENATKMYYIDLSSWIKMFLIEQLYLPRLSIHLISIQSLFHLACKMEDPKLVISVLRKEDMFKLHRRSCRPRHLNRRLQT